MSGNKDESIPAWSCGECADRLVTSSKRGECVWSLSPSSAFLKGLGCQVSPCDKILDKSPQISLKVDFVRPFNYDLKLGWLWHKSWNIPSITVALEVRSVCGSVVDSGRKQVAACWRAHGRPSLCCQARPRRGWLPLPRRSRTQGHNVPEPPQRSGPVFSPQVPHHLLLPRRIFPTHIT